LRRSLLRAKPARDDLRKLNKGARAMPFDRGIEWLFAFTRRWRPQPISRPIYREIDDFLAGSDVRRYCRERRTTAAEIVSSVCCEVS
jgi:hypothetical protein